MYLPHHLGIYGPPISTGFHACPKTLLELRNGTMSSLEHQINQYHCAAFKSAHYTPESCRMLHLNESIRIIRNQLNVSRVRTVFIGDSLGAQNAIAANCDFERDGITNIASVDYVESRTLRNDIPCPKKCAG